MWNYLNVSVKGTSHEATNIPCQDSNSCLVVEVDNSSQFLIAIVSDGAGSAVKAEIGSTETCHKFSDYLKNSLEVGISLKEITQDFFHNWITEYQNELTIKAASKELTIRDYASTFLVAVISDNSACFAQIGDGAIVVKGEDGEYSYMFAPQNGEYANETFFITDEKAVDQLQFEYLEKPFDQIAIFSDGIQNLVLDLQNNTVNQNFFSEWFKWLGEVKDKNIGEKILEDYLNSQKINELTNDDKTLILAIR